MIETFRRRGYRFNGEIKQPSEIEFLLATHTKTHIVTEEETSKSKISPKMPKKYFLAAGAGLVGLFLLAFGAARFFQSEPKNSQIRNSAAPIVKMMRLTPDQNIDVLGNQSNLWLLPIDRGQPRPLTTFEGGIIRNFAVSPDFKQIALSRGNPSGEVVLISNF